MISLKTATRLYKLMGVPILRDFSLLLCVHLCALLSMRTKALGNQEKTLSFLIYYDDPHSLNKHQLC